MLAHEPAERIRHSPAQWRPLSHLLAGAAGGVATAVVTSPLDVLRTRLQSDMYSGMTGHGLFRPIQSFTAAVRSISATQGWRGFYAGIGPSMAGVVPATATKLYVYGNSKVIISQLSHRSHDDALVHAAAATVSGLATATLTNPIWVVKTRLQLDKTVGHAPQYAGTLDCIRQVWQKEGLRVFYSGLSASYLGSIETVLHLVMYERLRRVLRSPYLSDEGNAWFSTTGAAGLAKVAAVIFAYPHEVVRTRLRQAPLSPGKPPYRGLFHCFSTVWLREGFSGLYGGLLPHMIRSIPSAMISLGVYEYTLRSLPTND